MNKLHLADGKSKESIRKGFGLGLVDAAKANDSVVALCADLTESTQMHHFQKAYPDRFVEVGVAEQNLVTVASGMAAVGKVPFISSYASFSPGRNWEQIRTTVCLNNQPVKIIGSHVGLYTGKDGATHQMLEDLALMRVLPNMVVLAPVDSIEARKATIAMANDPRPNYMRLTREATPIITTELTPFEIGKAYVFRPGKSLSLISTGVMTAQAMLVADKLAGDGIDVEVVHVPTIKPLDSISILNSIQKTGRVVTLEEGQIAGGLGGVVAEIMSEEMPRPLKRLGMHDSFGQSGDPEDLLKYYKLDVDGICKQIVSFINQTKKGNK